MTHSESNKRIAKNTLMLYIRMLITMFVGLFTSRVIINTLGEVDYGLQNVVGGVVVMFGFLNSAMANSTSRNLTHALGKRDIVLQQKTFSACVAIHIALALLVFVLAETVGLWFLFNKLVIPPERIDACFFVFQFSIIGSMLTIMNVPYMSSVIANEKMDVFAWMSIVDVILKLVIVYALYVTPFDRLILYSFLLLATNFVVWLIYRLYCICKFNECHCTWFWDKKFYCNLSSFAGWTLFGNIAVMLYGQGINILLNMFFGPSINAARAISSRVQMIVSQFSNSFQTALNPQITKAYASREMPYMYDLIYASSKYSCFLLYFLSLPIILEANQVLQIWLGIVPDYTVIFLQITLFSSIVDGISNPVIVAAQATGRIKKYQIIISSVLITIVPVSYLFLKLGCNPTSVYIVQLVTVIIAHIVRLLMIRPMINISLRKYVTKVFLRIIPVCFITTFVTLFIRNFFDENWWRIILVCTISSLLMLIFIYTIGLTHEERNFVLSRIKAYIKK